MADTEDDEVRRLQYAIADLQQKNRALCAMLRDAIHLADLAMELGAGKRALQRRRFQAKARARNGPFRGVSAKPPQV